MPSPLRSVLLTALWPDRGPRGNDLFAVLDGARDPRIVGRIHASISESACLYAGTLSPELAGAAPYLVRLYRDDWFCRALLDDGWGQAWGVFLESDASPPSLRRHLRQLLLVRDPLERRLVFRWYDPRVLRVYLPTCTREELRAVFGPVRSFVVEGDDAATLLRFTFDGERLVEARVPLRTAAG